MSYCNLCGSPTQPHCDSPSCPGWRRCEQKECAAYGPPGRMIRLPNAPMLDRPEESA